MENKTLVLPRFNYKDDLKRLREYKKEIVERARMARDITLLGTPEQQKTYEKVLNADLAELESVESNIEGLETLLIDAGSFKAVVSFAGQVTYAIDELRANGGTVMPRQYAKIHRLYEVLVSQANRLAQNPHLNDCDRDAIGGVVNDVRKYL